MLAKQTLGPSALSKNIGNDAAQVDGAPEPMLLPGNADDDLVQMLVPRRDNRCRIRLANSQPIVRPYRRIVSWIIGDAAGPLASPLPCAGSTGSESIARLLAGSSRRMTTTRDPRWRRGRQCEARSREKRYANSKFASRSELCQRAPETKTSANAISPVT